MDGVAIARRARERRYPEFVGVQAARLVVLVVEVGFSKETNGFLTRARSETPLLQMLGGRTSRHRGDPLGCRVCGSS